MSVTFVKRPKSAKPLLYVAGPYAKPEPVINTHNAIKVGDHLSRLGFDVYIPHLSLLHHVVCPRPEEFWYANDMAVLHRSDVVFRILGASTGADAEEDYAWKLGIPVFYEEESLLDWRDRW